MLAIRTLGHVGGGNRRGGGALRGATLTHAGNPYTGSRGRW
jgi:hypothetical protein